MTVLIANDTPDAIRGVLKRWFIEPKPNVFVGTISSKVCKCVLEYAFRNSPANFGVLVIHSASNCQGYEVQRIGPTGLTGRKEAVISGIPLIAESWVEDHLRPF